MELRIGLRLQAITSTCHRSYSSQRSRPFSSTQVSCFRLPRLDTRSYITQATVFNRAPDSIPQSLLPDGVPPPKTVVFLATADYLPLFSPQSTLLIDLARSVSGQRSIEENQNRTSDVQIIGAIVDGLPGSHLLDQPRNGQETSTTTTTTSIRDRRRRKGVSWLLTDEDVRIQPREFSNAAEEVTIRHESEKAGSLLIHFNETSDTTHDGSAANGAPSNERTLKVALGNTLFNAGTPCTLHYYRSKDDTLRALSSLDMFFPAALRINNRDREQAMIHLPLQPLTYPRRIHAGNGNILKSLSKAGGTTCSSESEHGDTEGDILPASKELELSIEKYRNGSKLPPGPQSVFAMIFPKNMDLIKEGEIGSGNGTEWEWGEVAGERGFRIRRVISGGGGWGQKAGLLALDPRGVEGFNIPMSSSDGDDGGAAGNDGGSLNVGDWVQFFISFARADESGKFGKSASFDTSRWSFSTMYPAEELYDFQSDQGHEDKRLDEAKQEEVVQGVFGCASEDAIYVDDTLIDVPGSEVSVPVSAK